MTIDDIIDFLLIQGMKRFDQEFTFAGKLYSLTAYKVTAQNLIRIAIKEIGKEPNGN